VLQGALRPWRFEKLQYPLFQIETLQHRGDNIREEKERGTDERTNLCCRDKRGELASPLVRIDGEGGDKDRRSG